MSKITITEDFKLSKTKQSSIKYLEKLNKMKNINDFIKIMDTNISNTKLDFIQKSIKKSMKESNTEILFEFLSSKVKDSNRKDTMHEIIGNLLKNDNLEEYLKQFELNINIKKKLIDEILNFREIYKIGERNLKKSGKGEDSKKIQNVLTMFDLINHKDDIDLRTKSEKEITQANKQKIGDFKNSTLYAYESLKKERKIPPYIKILKTTLNNEIFFTKSLEYYSLDKNIEFENIKELKLAAKKLIEKRFYLSIINKNSTIDHKKYEHLLNIEVKKFLKHFKQMIDFLEYPNKNMNMTAAEKQIKMNFKKLKNDIEKEILDSKTTKNSLYKDNIKEDINIIYSKIKTNIGITKKEKEIFEDNIEKIKEKYYIPHSYKNLTSNLKSNASQDTNKIFYLEDLKKQLVDFLIKKYNENKSQQNLDNASSLKLKIEYTDKLFKQAIDNIDFDFNQNYLEVLTIHGGDE